MAHYLEAKNIKNTYLLDDLYNSDESSDEESYGNTYDSDSENSVDNENNMIKN